jgi:(p)ppGpp synthase/HD superfamily hydrolase
MTAAAGGADLRAEAEHGLRVWAPLANRLGVWGLKAELEDLCFLVRTPTDSSSLLRTSLGSTSGRMLYWGPSQRQPCTCMLPTPMLA